MQTDHMPWYVTRDDDGFIMECGIRFYEGDVTTESETDTEGVTEDVTRYRRTKKLNTTELSHLSSDKFREDMSGRKVIVYTIDDFGTISTDNELTAFLNGELKKDPTRAPNDAQKETDLAKIEGSG